MKYYVDRLAHINPHARIAVVNAPSCVKMHTKQGDVRDKLEELG